MDRENIKKHLKIIGIYKYSQLKKGSLDKYWEIQYYKIRNSTAEKKRKNYLLIRLNNSKRVLSNFTEEEILSLLKEEKQTDTFERHNVSSNYQDRTSYRSNTGFNALNGRIPKELTFDEWIEDIVGFKINGCLMFLIFLLFVPTPIGWFLFLWWFLRRER